MAVMARVGLPWHRRQPNRHHPGSLSLEFSSFADIEAKSAQEAPII